MLDNLTRILCTGKNQPLCQSLADVLRAEGFSVTLTPAPLDAALLEPGSTKLCVYACDESAEHDVQLAELSRCLQARGTPLLLALAYSLDDRGWLESVARDAYLTAPVHPLALSSIVKSLLGRQHHGQVGIEPAALADVQSTAAQVLHERAEVAERSARSSAARVQQLEQEIERLSSFFSAPVAALAAQMYDGASLRVSVPELFDDFVRRLEDLLEAALEERVHNTNSRKSQQLRALGERLGFLRAMPRDVIEIYRTALDRTNTQTPEQKAQAYVQEGRLIVLELMGHLAAYYRVFYLRSHPKELHSLAHSEQGA